MAEKKTIVDYIEPFDLDMFLRDLKLVINDEPFYFANVGSLFRYKTDPTPIGMYVWSWLKQHRLKAKFVDIKTQSKYSDVNTRLALVFDTKPARDKFASWYNKQGFSDKTLLYPDDVALLKHLSLTQDGHYLSSGHSLDLYENDFELFHWLRTHISSGLFHVNEKFFFTNRNDELQYTLRWKNIETTEQSDE